MHKIKRIKRGDVALGLAAVSLFVAVGGPATAADLINGAQLQDRSVKGKKLARRAVSNSRLFRDAVGTGKVRDGSLTRADLAEDIFDGLQPTLTTNSITGDLLAGNSVGGDEIEPDGISGSDIAPGAIGNSDLAPGSVSAAKLENNSVTGAAADATGATTLNFGSIGNQACASLPVTVTGADISNNVIILTPGAGFTGSTATPVVTGSETFEVRVCNLTGAPADPDGASGVSYRWIAINS
jgi:hypothetical protein